MNKMRTGNKSMVFFIAVIFFIVIALFFVENNSSSTPNAGSTIQTINVLIYNGNVVDEDADSNLMGLIDSANSNNLVPGYHFNYNTTTVINSSILESYDVLIMPGDNDYISVENGMTIDTIDPNSIKNFVKKGGGYIGICAGAFAGSNYTQDYYTGWGVAPDVNCIQPNDLEDVINIQVTSAGNKVLDKKGNISVIYDNGPAMTFNRNTTVFAVYGDVIGSDGNTIIPAGNAAVVGDYYGKGRSVLIGPHFEEDPKSPDLMARLIVWAANK